MSQAVEIIRDRFNFYHVSIFLLDESETWAELAASTGEAGHKLITSHYRLAVGSASIIGWTTANRLLRVSQDITNDPFYYSNPLLPDTPSRKSSSKTTFAP
jgi:GAF domain-containing protein